MGTPNQLGSLGVWGEALEHGHRAGDRLARERFARQDARVADGPAEVLGEGDEVGVDAVAAAHGADAGGVDGRRPRGAAPVISHGRVKDYLICRAAARMGWSEFG